MDTPELSGKILGIDPGTTTGIACLKYHRGVDLKRFLRIPQLSWLGDCQHPFDLLKDNLRWASPETLVVIESKPTHSRNSGQAHVDEVEAIVRGNHKGQVLWVTPGFWKGTPPAQAMEAVAKRQSNRTTHSVDAACMAAAVGYRHFYLNKPLEG